MDRRVYLNEMSGEKSRRMKWIAYCVIAILLIMVIFVMIKSSVSWTDEEQLDREGYGSSDEEPTESAVEGANEILLDPEGPFGLKTWVVWALVTWPMIYVLIIKPIFRD